MFGGDVHYDGYGQFDRRIWMMPLASNTGYLGLRGEYEFVLAPPPGTAASPCWPDWAPASGSATCTTAATAQGDPVYGYQETWWTMYPYLGLETHRRLGERLGILFGIAGRRDGPDLSICLDQLIGPCGPEPGILANMEIGLAVRDSSSPAASK